MKSLLGRAKRAFSLSLTSLMVLVATSGAMGQSVPPELVSYPELILHNGKILTVDDRFSMVQAVAIRDGRFLKVGRNQEVLALRGPATQVIDLRGRSVVPGFGNAHGHGWGGGASMPGQADGGSLRCETVEKCVEEVRAAVSEAQPGQWVSFGGGIRNDVLVNQITRWDLDKGSPNNPIFIDMSTQMGIINTAAWEQLRPRLEGLEGIFRDPETDEPNGHIRGQANGVITYEFEEWPEDWDTREVEEQKEQFRVMNSEGVTFNIGRINGLGISVLNELWRKGELTVRARPALEFAMLNPQAEVYLKRVGNLSGLGDDWLRVIGLTVGPPDGNSRNGGLMSRFVPRRELLQPGGFAWNINAEDRHMSGENKWAFSRADNDWSGEGTEFETIVLANRYGWSVQSIHAQGDIGAKMILDAFEKADRERPIKGRYFAFDHGLIRTEEDLQRAARLDVTNSFAFKYLLGEDRGLAWMFGEDAHRFTPIQTAIDLGLKPALELEGAQMEGKSSSLVSIEKFMTRRDNQGRTWGGAREAISREDALRMATIWTAAYSGDEKRLGSIEEGKLADLVVLGGDYMTVPEDKIDELPVDFTIVGGKIVYDRDTGE